MIPPSVVPAPEELVYMDSRLTTLHSYERQVIVLSVVAGFGVGMLTMIILLALFGERLVGRAIRAS